ncbi:hypothetical protein [Jannaschia seohaensis]|uniref:Uncharacterized protein n=1 Tax=Jannaschia seohaensis TaxID=475081 RepID=A0A2Y9C8Y8_9RHOB|nr:hypothetical protein [Jannaschia seohaensis]PWJ12935.1 hypothetical protein BCF38_11571 [Jannaschia seohaensis]SSA50743.1 hypothetical protein SAMN05421539_11571 [Jannaschia seohaensis]
MSTKIATASQPETSLPSLDTVLPVSRREIYWRPKYVADSAFLDHLPVLFWLMGDLRPQNVVTLGGGADGSAVAHLALCQSVERLGLDADCTGIGTWPGSEQGETTPPEELADYADSQYSEFARLVSASDAVAPGLFDAGSVDLLVVDRALDAELLAGLAAWDDRFSEKGCLVLRGTETARHDPALIDALERLQADRPVLRFSHGGGLWVLAAGGALPGRLARMAELEGDRTLGRAMSQVFQRLGSACTNEWEARRATRIEGKIRRELSELRPEVERLKAVETSLSAELSELRAAHEAQSADLDRQARAAATAERDRMVRITALQADLERRSHALDTATSEREALDEEIERLKAALEAAAGERGPELAEQRDAAEMPGASSPAQTEALAKLTALLAEAEEREAALARELAARGGAPAPAADADQVAALKAKIKRITKKAERDRAALEEDNRRLTEDRAAAMRTVSQLRATLAARGRGGTEGEAARDLALGEAMQTCDRLEAEVAELRDANARQARELATLTAQAEGGAPRAAQLAERAATELARSEQEARDLASALSQALEELERTKRDLARMTGRKEHLEARIRAELGG